MTPADVIRVFGNDVLVLPGGAQVTAEKFAELFYDAGSNPTYANLVAIDGGTMGYKEFFDQCKEQGILN